MPPTAKFYHVQQRAFEGAAAQPETPSRNGAPNDTPLLWVCKEGEGHRPSARGHLKPRGGREDPREAHDEHPRPTTQGLRGQASWGLPVAVRVQTPVLRCPPRACVTPWADEPLTPHVTHSTSTSGKHAEQPRRAGVQPAPAITSITELSSCLLPNPTEKGTWAKGQVTVSTLGSGVQTWCLSGLNL